VKLQRYVEPWWEYSPPYCGPRLRTVKKDGSMAVSGVTRRYIWGRARCLALRRAAQHLTQRTRQGRTTCATPIARLRLATGFDMVYNWDDKEAECYRLYVEESRRGYCALGVKGIHAEVRFCAMEWKGCRIFLCMLRKLVVRLGSLLHGMEYDADYAA
jgi:hypothetical protein